VDVAADVVAAMEEEVVAVAEVEVEEAHPHLLVRTRERLLRVLERR